MEYLDIIDIETDRVIGNASHDEIYEKKLPHRIVHVVIYRSNGKIVLQKRSLEKYHYPNTWTTSSCWHVSSWESTEEAAVRETQEEIGVTPNISLIKKLPYLSEGWITKLLAIYKASYDGSFTLNFEVSEIREFSITEIKELPAENLHPEFHFLIENDIL